MEYQIEYTPTAYDLSERAYGIAQAPNLIEANASCSVSMDAAGLRATYLCLQAWYRKPGETSDRLDKGHAVTVSGRMEELELAYMRFQDAVRAIKAATVAVAA